METVAVGPAPHLQGQPVPDGPVAQPSGRPHPRRSTQTGTSATGASGRHQDGNQPTSDWGGNPPTSNRGGKSASTGRGGKPATSGGPVDLPSEREGAGNGQNWYEWPSGGLGGEAFEPQGPPYPIGTAQVRREAIGQIYNHMAGKDPPPCNVASEAIRAYYPGTEAQTLKTWACQVLCMISEYHMACVTRGSPVTSPILPGVIEDKLPLLTGYALPEDRSGISGGDTISPEEEAILLDETPQPEDLATGSHSPRSETTMVSGGMAELYYGTIRPGPYR